VPFNVKEPTYRIPILTENGFTLDWLVVSDLRCSGFCGIHTLYYVKVIPILRLIGFKIKKRMHDAVAIRSYVFLDEELDLLRIILLQTLELYICTYITSKDALAANCAW